MPIAIPRAPLERGWPRLSARGALAAAPASIPNTAVRILPVIALDLEVYTLDCMLALQTLLLFFIRWGVVEGKRFGRTGLSFWVVTTIFLARKTIVSRTLKG